MDLDDDELRATRKLLGVDKKRNDINVVSLEEFLKEYNKLKKYKNIISNIDTNFFFYFIDTLLEDYTRQKQINEEHQKINGELRTQIKFLEIKLEFKQWGDLDDLRFEEYMNEFVPKQKIKDKFNEIQLLYEKNLKEVNLKEVEKIDKKIFEGISLEAQREFARELLQQEDKK